MMILWGIVILAVVLALWTITWGLTVGINDGTGAPPIQWNVTGEVVQEIEDTVPNSTTNKLYTFNFTRSKVQVIAFWYTGLPTSLTLKLNSSSAPTDTITLVPGIPYFWAVSSGVGLSTPTELLSSDVTTGVYVTNADSTNSAVFHARALSTS
jgi:hypothetical protein